ncbi:DUF4304 domain-containing protein [Nonlabens sp. SY33080]|uniref:DUF4304 domain-containing protein n=1 Tax=Nonlabens sp. SY33080 TaxID=2719911 RepID=UPI0014289837|nr:DUF4304 domain-containing protein [Nonlabens sp. SY33080]
MKSTEFKKIVTKEIAPFLRENKWKGSGFDYNKQTENIVKAIKFQPNRYGGEFCIDLGVHFDFIPIANKVMNKLRAWDMEIRTRLTPNNESDYWWSFPKNETDQIRLFTEIKELINNKGNTFFDKYTNWENTILKFTSDDITSGNTKEYFNITSLRTALMLAKMNVHKENWTNAIELSNFGLSEIKGRNGSALIPEFEEIIKKAGNNIFKK